VERHRDIDQPYNRRTLSRPPDEELFDDELAADEEVGAAWQRFKEVAFSRRTAIFAGVFIVAAISFFYVLLPLLPGLRDGLRRVQEDADRTWLAVAFFCELGSYASYVWLFHIVYAPVVPRIGWRESYHISMAGVAATRVLGAAGAGGIALSYWATRRAGLTRRDAASRQVGFLVVLYAVFLGALIVDGLLLYTGVVPGPAPLGVTMIPALFALMVYALFLLTLLLPDRVENIVERLSLGSGSVARVARRLVQVPAMIGEGTRAALEVVRHRPQALMAGAGWWAFDIAVLWACFKAFGGTPTLGVVVMGYLVGMVANVIPVPGGIGAVEGGMIGAYVAFGVSTGPAVAAVLAYRLFAFFLPTLPGIVSYGRLLKSVGEWREEDATIKSKVLKPEGA
jgi:uncharacterized protein (TIRG00374 family)